MKVLLSHGYFIHEDKAESKIMMPYPPQGLLHIGAFLKSKGIDCEIFDSTFKSFSEFCAFLDIKRPKYLALYVNLMTRPNILKIISFIRNSEILQNTTVILGGPDVRHHANLYVQHGADFCLSGEGENSLYQLIVNLDKRNFTAVYKLKGVTLKNENQEIIFTGEPDMKASIEDLPFPDFQMINIQKYFSVWKKFHAYSSLTISTMRGCPYSCRWCSKAVFGRSFRRRSALSVVNELQHLQKAYSPDRFWFVDDVFTINKQWMLEFRNSIVAAKINIKYECITRADKMDEEIIQLLKESGCYRVWIGAESGSQKILDLMDRGVKIDIVRSMIKKSQMAGLEAGTFLMIGYPGEDEKDIFKTVDHLKSANPDHYTITLSYPIPGTEFYKQVEDGIQAPGNWGTYSDRELDFKRTYKQAYYPYAIRYVNNAIKTHKLLQEGKVIKAAKRAVITKVLRTLMFLNR